MSPKQSEVMIRGWDDPHGSNFTYKNDSIPDYFQFLKIMMSHRGHILYIVLTQGTRMYMV